MQRSHPGGFAGGHDVSLPIGDEHIITDDIRGIPYHLFRPLLGASPHSPPFFYATA